MELREDDPITAIQLTHEGLPLYGFYLSTNDRVVPVTRLIYDIAKKAVPADTLPAVWVDEDRISGFRVREIHAASTPGMLAQVLHIAGMQRGVKLRFMGITHD